MSKLTGLWLGAILIIHAPAGFAAMDAGADLSIGLSEAVERAIQNSEEIKIRAESIRRMQGTYRNVRAGALPQLDGRVAWDRYIESPVITVDFGDGIRHFPIKQDYDFSAGATLNQVVYAFGKVSTAVDIAKSYIGLEYLQKDIATHDLVFLTKHVYLTLLYAKEAARIANESHRNAADNLATLQNRFRSGRISRADNVKMAADVELRVPIKLEAESRRESLMIGLKRLINAPEQTNVTLTDSLTTEFPPLDPAELRERLKNASPELIALREQITLNSRFVALRKSDYLPTLNARADYAYAGNGPRPFPRSEMQSALFAGLVLEAPLFDSGRRAGALEEARSDLSAARLRFEKLERDLTEDLDKTIAEYRASVQIHTAGLKAFSLAESAYQITLSSFKAGTSSQTQLNDAELQLTNAKLQVERNRFSLNVLLAKIHRLTGQR